MTETIRQGIVDLGALMQSPKLQALDLVLIMMSALVAAALRLPAATRQGWPGSTTHSIVGSAVALGATKARLGLAQRRE